MTLHLPDRLRRLERVVGDGEDGCAQAEPLEQVMHPWIGQQARGEQQAADGGLVLEPAAASTPRITSLRSPGVMTSAPSTR